MLDRLAILIAQILTWRERKIAALVDNVVYRLPGAPPTGSRVKTVNGDVFRREIPPENQAEFFGQWGSWRDVATGALVHWASLLSDGPLLLLADDTEPELVRLYGPTDAQWGDPSSPCPYGSCALGLFHIGAHIDAEGRPLGQAHPDDIERGRYAANVTSDDMETFCTCGHPGRHLPTCARYGRMTGAEQATPPAGQD